VSGNCTGSGSGQVESDVVGVHNGIIENYNEREKHWGQPLLKRKER
jgi:glucosamine 6-phosphate synthetase-like amidotransferase/phosphosugar isomerase protein